MMRHLHDLRGDRTGAALVELALILPILLTLYMGSFEVTRLVLANMKLSNAAQTMANLIAGQDTVSPSLMADFYSGTKLVMAPFSGTPLQVASASVKFNSGGTRTLVWSDTEGSATAIANATTLASGMGNSGDSVILVQATYTYTSPIHYVLPVSFTLSQLAYARPRNVLQIPHS
jgi:Flp pilus assembly protein TadG